MLPPLAALAAVGQTADVEIDIAGAALQLARLETAEDGLADASAHLSALARDAVSLARETPAGALRARAMALSELLAGQYGYAGDVTTYDDPANANLIRVTERRRGLPVALGIIWLHCARAAGWGAHGIDFPGHFLLALEGEPDGKRRRVPPGPHVVLDVFAGGLPVTTDDLRRLLRQVAGDGVEMQPGVLHPMSARRVLLRLQENLRIRRLGAGDHEGALASTDAMLAIAPDMATLWREKAQLTERLDRLADALEAHRRFLDLVPSGDAAKQARAAMDALRARLH